MVTGQPVLVSCVDVRAARRVGELGGHLIATREKGAREHLDAAQALIHRQTPPPGTSLLAGQPLRSLLDTVESERASLIAVGTRGHSRVAGVVFGSAVSGLLREGTCSILITRDTGHANAFPRVVIVGVDGSTFSMAAMAAAFDIGRRLSAKVVPVVAARRAAAHRSRMGDDPLPAPDSSGALVLALDLHTHEPIAEHSDGRVRRVSLTPDRSVGHVTRELLAAVRELLPRFVSDWLAER